MRHPSITQRLGRPCSVVRNHRWRRCGHGGGRLYHSTPAASLSACSSRKAILCGRAPPPVPGAAGRQGWVRSGCCWAGLKRRRGGRRRLDRPTSGFQTRGDMLEYEAALSHAALLDSAFEVCAAACPRRQRPPWVQGSGFSKPCTERRLRRHRGQPPGSAAGSSRAAGRRLEGLQRPV